MSESSLELSFLKDRVLVPVRVTPRGSRNAVTGTRNGALLISVTAPPAEGAANAAVMNVLREVLSCPKSALELYRGEKSRDKVIAVSGLAADEVRERLNLQP